MKREFLVTKFVCAKCGGLLELDYAPTPGRAQHCDGEPTGAAMVASTIAIEPCKTCMGPLAEVQAAVKTLLAAGRPAEQ